MVDSFSYFGVALLVSLYVSNLDAMPLTLKIMNLTDNIDFKMPVKIFLLVDSILIFVQMPS